MDLNCVVADLDPNSPLRWQDELYVQSSEG